jgi:protein gp37
MRLAGTRLQHHPSRAGLTTPSKAGPVWNNLVRLNEHWLDQPRRWTRPRRIFVCAHGDLFHEAVPDSWLDRIFSEMHAAPQHTYQVLTKRPARMREYLQWQHPWPNVWLGVSAEDQARANERIPELLATRAAVRFWSYEPGLGPVDATAIDTLLFRGAEKVDALGGILKDFLGVDAGRCPTLDWVIAGGESGPGARPMHPGWVRQLRDQCAAAGVPFFFKQWGAWAPREQWSGHLGGGRFEPMLAILRDGSRCPDDAAPQDVGAHRMAQVGKKAAGRLLDGVTHDAMPAARA